MKYDRSSPPRSTLNTGYITASDTVFSDQSPVGADPRYSPALGPWGDPPLTIYAKGTDDMGQGKGKSSGKDKGIDYGKAKGKHKTKDKRASPYKGGSYEGHEGKGGQDYPLGKGKGKEGKEKGKGKNPNKVKTFLNSSPPSGWQPGGVGPLEFP